MTRTIEQIKQDLDSYKTITKRQKGATLYAEKYVEDVGVLIAMLEAKEPVVPAAEFSSPASVVLEDTLNVGTNMKKAKAKTQ